MVFRSWRDGQRSVPGFAVDVAFLVQGLLDLYRADGELRWLQTADALHRAGEERFGDPASGVWFDHSGDDPSLVLRTSETYDGAEPAATSVMIRNGLRLAEIRGDAALHERCGTALDAACNGVGEAVTAAPLVTAGLVAWHHGSRRLVLVPGDDPAELAALRAVAREALMPYEAVIVLDAEQRAWLAADQPALAAMVARDGRATAYPVRGPRVRRRPPIQQAYALSWLAHEQQPVRACDGWCGLLSGGAELEAGVDAQQVQQFGDPLADVDHDEAFNTAVLAAAAQIEEMAKRDRVDGGVARQVQDHARDTARYRHA